MTSTSPNPLASRSPESAGLSARLDRRRFLDRAAGWLVGVGGLATIASVSAILLFLAFEVAPLWRSPQVTEDSKWSLPSEVGWLAVLTDEYREVVYGVTEAGRIQFRKSTDGSLLQEVAIEGWDSAKAIAAAAAGDQIAVLADGGEAYVVKIRFATRRQGEEPRRATVSSVGHWPVFDTPPGEARIAASDAGETGVSLVAATPGRQPIFLGVTQTTNLFGDVQSSLSKKELPLRSPASISALALSRDGKRAFVGATDGTVYGWDVRDAQAPQLIDAVEGAPRGTAISALQVLIGGSSLVVGDASGRISVWFPVRDAVQDSGWRLQRVHELDGHAGAVGALAASYRDKGFLSADINGNVALHHATTARTLSRLDSSQGGTRLVFAPRANGAVSLGQTGSVRVWSIYNPHPDVSFDALFRRVWYEGYDAPAYVWQSSGGTDDFEPKLSLIPLIIGTLKGTLYALLFAVPIAVLAAIYTSQFVHPNVRAAVKPIVEIMAALPSVVLGFLAGLWLAPTLEGLVPAVLAMLLWLPLLTFAFGVAWQALPAAVRGRLRPGYELILLAALLVLGAWMCLALNHSLEEIFFRGDVRAWLSEQAGLRFDQRNCLVVGLAMGFAIIPLIFTISEDALSNVPPRLVSASLALGATRWQTAVRVVLPTASPGIFSAIMIGFGRAVGETMIVLMATGNTPVLDFNIFTGMRSLSANIAVEIPEAAQGSSLYRVLFLAALLLFAATFCVNTVAELVRQRLRQRYQQL